MSEKFGLKAKANSNRRSKLERIVRALQSKTKKSGATDAEALAAAEKARELIFKYQIFIGPEEMVAEGLDKWEITAGDYLETVFYNWTLPAIAKYCEVKAFQVGTKPLKFGIIGLRSDMELFKWMVEHLAKFAVKGAVTYGVRRIAYWQRNDKRKMCRKVKSQFVTACGKRITTRINWIFHHRNKDYPSSRALVPIDKLKLLDDFLADQGLNLTKGRHMAQFLDPDAHAAGIAHGDNATFGRPIGKEISAYLRAGG